MDQQTIDILEAEKESGMIQHQAIAAINDLYRKGYYLELAEVRDLAAKKTGEMKL